MSARRLASAAAGWRPFGLVIVAGLLAALAGCVSPGSLTAPPTVAAAPLVAIPTTDPVGNWG